MFWTLLLAHLVADYPLQSNWLIRVKRTPWGLALHVAIHLVVMSVLVWPILPQVWRVVAAIGVFHFALDAGKNALTARRPQWHVSSYLTDQALHVTSLWLAAAWVSRHLAAVAPPLQPNLAILLSGYLFATYIWFISERIFAHRDEIYQEEIHRFALVRMGARGLLLTVFLLAGRPMSGEGRLALVLGLPLPYVSGVNRRRAALTDVLVAFTTACVILIFSAQQP